MLKKKKKKEGERERDGSDTQSNPLLGRKKKGINHKTK